MSMAAKSRPINRTVEQVQAIQRGATQMRVPVTLPLIDDAATGWPLVVDGPSPSGAGQCVHSLCADDGPFGTPGDRLWVREVWQHLQNQNNEPASVLEPKGASDCFYQADESDPAALPISGRWRQSNHMPRWASRITLAVKRVWVERVQDINDDGAKAEGVEGSGVTWWGGKISGTGKIMHACERPAFASLWDSAYAKRGYGWDTNPWVFACEFERI